MMMAETTVLIIGAGPAGLATSACLNLQKIPNLVLEKEDCHASLWKMRSYDRLKLHLAKEFCQLPHMPFHTNAPTFLSKKDFIEYLDNYVSHFNINPLCQRVVESSSYDEINGKWIVLARNVQSGVVENYGSRFVVVASGENSDGFVPEIPGLNSFNGVIMHSNQYKNGEEFYKKDVLVVGCGNSGMEIAYDLSNWGARVSVVARNPVHVLTKEMVHAGMTLLKYIPCNIVDNLMLMLCKFKHGDLSKYGLQKPAQGPFYLKRATGRSPTIDVGAVEKIIDGHIKVLPSIKEVNGSNVEFSNGELFHFDSIVFATGYRSLVKNWLKNDGGLFTDDGMPKGGKSNHWKGENGIYCAGYSRSGLFGISNDAKNIAQDIHTILLHASSRRSDHCKENLLNKFSFF